MDYLKVGDLDGNTEFRILSIPGWEGLTDLRLEKSPEVFKKEAVIEKVGLKRIVGDNKYYFRASAKIGGVYQTKVPIFVATNLETNLSI